MFTSVEKDMTENATMVAGRMTSKSSHESINGSDPDSDNENDNENATGYEEETILSEGFDRMHWPVFANTSLIQVQSDDPQSMSLHPRPFQAIPSSNNPLLHHSAARSPSTSLY